MVDDFEVYKSNDLEVTKAGVMGKVMLAIENVTFFHDEHYYCGLYVVLKTLRSRH